MPKVSAGDVAIGDSEREYSVGGAPKAGTLRDVGRWRQSDRSVGALARASNRVFGRGEGVVRDDV